MNAAAPNTIGSVTSVSRTRTSRRRWGEYVFARFPVGRVRRTRTGTVDFIIVRAARGPGSRGTRPSGQEARAQVRRQQRAGVLRLREEPVPRARDAVVRGV